MTSDGRIGRGEYLLNLLIIALIGGVLHTVLLLSGLLDIQYSQWVTLCVTAVLVSFPAVQRLHDTNNSGAVLLLALVPLVNLVFGLYLLFAPGTNGQNKYGPPPNRRKRVKTASISPLSGSEPFGAPTLDTEPIYAEIMNNLGSQKRNHPGVWAKAFADGEGNEQKAEALFIKYRVQQAVQTRREEESERIAAAENWKEAQVRKKQVEDRENLRTGCLALSIAGLLVFILVLFLTNI